MIDLSVDLPGLQLKNPIMPASGCFGFGREYSAFYDLSKLGAVMMKETTGSERPGNPTPRIAEIACVMLNVSCIQIPGVEEIIATEVTCLAQSHLGTIANIAGSSVEAYGAVARTFNDTKHVHAPESKISCPTV